LAKILMLEDEVALAEVVVASLRAQDHAVTVVTDVAAALAALRAECFDALILDMFIRDPGSGALSGQGGLSVIQAVRRPLPGQALATPPEVRIVCVSGAMLRSGSATVLRVSESLGADAVLDKPFSPRALFAALDLPYLQHALPVWRRRQRD
jgi:CheY-like chemotaxis protein